MTTDEVLKTILIVSISFSILIVSYQIARLLLEMRKTLNENRKSLKKFTESTSEFSEFAKEDYQKIRSIFGFASTPAKSMKALVDFGIAGKLFSMMRGSRKKSK